MEQTQNEQINDAINQRVTTQNNTQQVTQNNAQTNNVEQHVGEEEQFIVKTLSGKSIVCELNPKLTIHELKEAIFEAERLPVNQQRLVYKGKQLENDKTLGDYEIDNGSTIHLLAQLKGGF